MRLTERERELIAYFQLAADTSVEAAARDLGYKTHQARFTLQKLHENEVIYPYLIINHHLLGFLQFDVYFSRPHGVGEESSALLNDCLSEQRVPWVVEVGGDYQYGVTVLVRNPAELEVFFNRLSLTHGEVFREKSIVLCLGYSVFRRCYLGYRADDVNRISCFGDGQTVDVDELDKRLITALSLFPTASLNQIASELSESRSTLQYRVDRLREAGVIGAVVYSLNTEKVGIQSFRFFLQLKSFHHEILESLFSFCDELGSVSYLTRCVGAWDFELTLEVEDSNEVTSFRSALQNVLGSHLGSVKSVPVFREQISGPYPFVDTVLD